MLRRDGTAARQLRDQVRALRDSDPDLVRAIEREFGVQPAPLPGLDPAAPLPPGGIWEGGAPEMVMQAIIWRKGRPALAVRGGSFDPADPDDPEASVLLDRLEGARARLEPLIPAVGRIEVEGNAEGELAGTGWLVAPEIVVTNAHVAQKFAMRFGAGYRFRASVLGDGRQSARIDFLAEAGSDCADEIAIREILWIAPDGQPDIALLGLERAAKAPPIPLAEDSPQAGTHVAAVGYPVRDGEYPDPALMDAIFQGLYTHKCLSPGMVRGSTGSVMHDCSTLRGNSGSPVIDMGSGLAVGLHFLGGRLQGDNYAVPAHVLSDRLAELQLI